MYKEIFFFLTSVTIGLRSVSYVAVGGEVANINNMMCVVEN